MKIFAVLLFLIYSTAGRYDDREARMLLDLAAGAYGEDEEIQKCTSKAIPGDGETVLSVSVERCDPWNNPCESFIVSSNSTKTLYISFRGSKGGSQVLLEGWSSLQPGIDFFEMGQVNQYFYRGHKLLWGAINQTLKEPAFSKFRVVFTGHSLGGALAALAAARTSKEGLRRPNQVRLVTFGEPRVGTSEFAFNFDNLVPESYRVVFRKDIVPHLPACAKNSSDPKLTRKDIKSCDAANPRKAYHHGTEIWYPTSMKPGAPFLECRGLPRNEDADCSNRLKFDLKFTPVYVWDHRHYFNVKVGRYGKNGCNDSLSEIDPLKHGRKIIVNSV